LGKARAEGSVGEVEGVHGFFEGESPLLFAGEGSDGRGTGALVHGLKVGDDAEDPLLIEVFGDRGRGGCGKNLRGIGRGDGRLGARTDREQEAADQRRSKTRQHEKADSAKYEVTSLKGAICPTPTKCLAILVPVALKGYRIAESAIR
jgi:hypothetical protein